VWSFRVEFFSEAIESQLLALKGRGGRTRRFSFQSLVHAFVSSVLLRSSWLDELGEDSQTNPPDGESTQTPDGGRRERCPVVGPNYFWKSEATEELREYWLGKNVLGGQQGFAFEKKATAAVRHRQGIAVDPVPGLEFTLVVCAPHIVRAIHSCHWFSRMTWERAASSGFHKAMSLQNLGNGRPGGPGFIWTALRQDSQ
jgi:hypothetical protein